MGGEEGEGAAPLGDGFGDGVELALVAVEGEFIKDDVAGFADDGVGVGGEAVDAEAVGEFEGLDPDGAVGKENALFGKGGDVVKGTGPAPAVAEELAGLNFIAAGDPDIQPGIAVGDEADGLVGGGITQSDLASFFDEDEAG